MSHGTADVVTVYDASGNPVQAKLINGNYQLVTSDERLHDDLNDIKALLIQLTDLLTRSPS